MSTEAMPPLPDPWDYCYEWQGPYGTRKFSIAPHNGRRCDNTVPLYTADQMRAYALAALEEARKGGKSEELAMMIRMLVSSLRRHWPQAPQPNDLPSRAMALLRAYGLQGSPLRDEPDRTAAPSAAAGKEGGR